MLLSGDAVRACKPSVLWKAQPQGGRKPVLYSTGDGSIATSHALKKTVEIPSFGIKKRTASALRYGARVRKWAVRRREGGIVVLYSSSAHIRLMAAQRGTCQLRGQWRKKTLTPNYRPHAHCAHADMSCQLHHVFFFFLTRLPKTAGHCAGQSSSIDVILFSCLFLFSFSTTAVTFSGF